MVVPGRMRDGIDNLAGANPSLPAKTGSNPAQ